MCYLFGEGVAQDDGQALKWLSKAAAKGDKNAQAAIDWIKSGKKK